MPLSILGAVLRGQTPSPSRATSTNKADTPPQRQVMSHDEPQATTSLARSWPASSGSNTTDEKPSKRIPRAKTSYNIARPVHARSKLHIRPRVLLQLHQVIASQRPKPAYEIIPFSLLPQRSTRRLARTFNTRNRLGPNDLLIVRAEAYDSRDGGEERPDDERWGSRDVIGVICPRKSEKGMAETTQICLSDGMSRWEVSDMPNGGYEFNSMNEHGLTLKARWVLKPAHARRASSMSSPIALSPAIPSGLEDKKFTFSTISANSRRHPIIATMTRARIDVMDTYAMPSATFPPTSGSPSHAASPTTTPSTIELTSFIDHLTEKLPIETDDTLRRFILVSGVWVALQNFSSDSSSQSLTPALARPAIFRSPSSRAVSMFLVDSPRTASPVSTMDDTCRSSPRVLRPSMERLLRRTSNTDPPSPELMKTIRSSSPVKARSRRANSTGTAQLHSSIGSVRKRYGLASLALQDQTLDERPEERQLKCSVELLRTKELALPSTLERPSAETARLPLAAIPPPTVISLSSEGPTSPAPLLGSPLLSLSLPNPERTRKTQSYAPITTTGMWDSGVTVGPGLKKRPTSMFVLNEKKRKQEKRNECSKSKDRKTEHSEDSGGLGLKRKSDWYMYKIKLRLKELFKKEKA
ncbi:hypothetical protein EJ02DRAFT_452149 [Clathrospora elynae]|uniref:Uncharacterized protein n=1 Tax=Clathrospora elynae TaxID=706981 RepID=A0A6A5SYL7_9PLEO|nr:hypothetical protein EJ02DRAFT_452149 [Clathrospora elynae]